MIENGSFEKPVVPEGSFNQVQSGGKVGPWVVVGQGNVAPISGSYQQSGLRFPSKKGVQWIDLTAFASNSATGVEQTVRTTRGEDYELAFHVGNIKGGGFGKRSSVQVFVDGEPLMDAVNTSGTSTQVWRRFAVTITAERSRTKIRFINGDGGSDNSNGLDAVTLTPVVSV